MLRFSNYSLSTVALSFVIPSEAEGSAVPRTFPGNAEYDAQEHCHLACSNPNDLGSGAGVLAQNIGVFVKRLVISRLPSSLLGMTMLLSIVFRVSRKGPRNRRSLGFARDDKGKGNG
jgi:hypothetical protein